MIDSESMLQRYLDRLGIVGLPGVPNLKFLTQLQAAHLVTVPFENLDVFHRVGVSTELDHSLSKIVDRQRGGWCFELNGAFGWLLSQLGFDTNYISCRVFGDDEWGPELDHCGIVVTVEDQRWYVDVGFGDNCMVPILIVDGERHGVPRLVNCKVEGSNFVISEQDLDGLWTDKLWCSLEPRTLDDFIPRSDYLQTEPGLMWTEKPFATQATSADGSRVTLRNRLLRQRSGIGDFVDTVVQLDQWDTQLKTHFGITISS